ncbi:hypothetical protein G1H11_13700 [Phytoactinopolyspora alkaliphila]|uniref:Uncharacterized protein n=1 Tax=Phytoactinopolyspora alkaliphila TaxID=1783498 RepID=A0A6N9YN64_9ACTN|nr:hypothetical protein [Phytoactinopolyspora alkaliphila]NED96360.1 hypothetical protein [Phytoactinopolyspora alkaliphila]
MTSEPLHTVTGEIYTRYSSFQLMGRYPNPPTDIRAPMPLLMAVPGWVSFISAMSGQDVTATFELYDHTPPDTGRKWDSTEYAEVTIPVPRSPVMSVEADTVPAAHFGTFEVRPILHVQAWVHGRTEVTKMRVARPRGVEHWLIRLSPGAHNQIPPGEEWFIPAQEYQRPAS